MAEWFAENATTLDIVVIMTILLLVAERVRSARRQLRKNERRRIINALRGALMPKADQDKFFMMRFEDAIEDEIQELIHEGRLTGTQEREYRAMFADFGLIGLYPMRDVKRGIQQRLKKLYDVSNRPLDFLNGKKATPVKKAAPKKAGNKYASEGDK